MTNTNEATDQNVSTAASTVSTEIKAEEITYPLVRTTDEPDGAVMVTTKLDEKTPATWVKTYADGKKVSLEADGLEVTRYPQGNIEFTLPQSKIKVEIAVGYGKDIAEARRLLNGKTDEAAFMLAMYAQLTKFDGKFMVPEDIGRKLRLNDYLTLEGYFAEVNFS